MNTAFTQQKGFSAPRPVAFYLKDQENTLDELYHLLENERRALRSRDISVISMLAEQKSRLMVKLQGNDQKIRLNPQAELLKTTFRDKVDFLKNRLCECKKLNEINGRIISLSLNSTRKVSALLMQVRDRTTRNLTYNDKGCTTARGPMRLNIEA